MSKFKTGIMLLKEDKKELLCALGRNFGMSKISRIFPDWLYLRIQYRLFVGEKLNLKKPKTFNEKMQWLKLYNRKPEYIELVDKIQVKSHISRIIGEEYVIPTLGCWNSFDEIDFSSLPNQFVLKCNHDSGSVVICKDKESFDFQRAEKQLTKKVKTDMFFWGREWPYKGVKPFIFAEKYIADSNNKELNDYKFMCFNGKVKCLFVCSDRFSSDGLKVTFYDKKWNVLPFERHYPKSKSKIDKPVKLEKMIELAELISCGMPFSRVDFYEVNGNVYFGEITLFPGSGFEEFTPKKWDKILGKLICLPEKKQKKG